MVRRELQQRRRKYRAILFKRLAARKPLWTPGDMTPLDMLQWELGDLRKNNLELCKSPLASAHSTKFFNELIPTLYSASQVADLNITSTNLQNKLNLLRQRSLTLSDQLSRLEEEVKAKKEERERQGPKNMAQLQTELIKLRRELEVSHSRYTILCQPCKQTFTAFLCRCAIVSMQIRMLNLKHRRRC